ncbi:thioredoxin [Naegleria gruberi]|uniref:Thioredoxin n=1 Tax=Naegleria gruberi TaxID=5762 RepID=D2V4N1_NAEGR|nr:thioredoxin [Naegleria gruberi]EFC48132.1 thioredoxin [Naegleria gruberi]|eukprot:XP_002680876.1 thioredoxin [Naegleria gruberi]
MVKQVDSHSELKSLIEGHEGLVVVDFFATWCGPCKRIAPTIEEWSKTHTTVLFLKVDVDINDESASVYSVEAMPTFLFFKGGQKIKSVVGANPNALLDVINENK